MNKYRIVFDVEDPVTTMFLTREIDADFYSFDEVRCHYVFSDNHVEVFSASGASVLFIEKI